MRRAVILVLLAACGGGTSAPKEQAPTVPEPPAEAITKESDQGAAKVTVRVWPARPNLGDSIWLRLDADAPDGTTVDMPFDQDALGRFGVLHFYPDKGHDTYELSAPMSGKQRIPPLRVVVHEGGKDTELLTEEIPIEVGTVLANRTDAPLSAPRAALPTEVGAKSLWPWFLGGAAALIVIGGAIALWILLRSRAVRRARITAWELAMSRLAELAARGAPAADDADTWFVDLSNLIRAYVEGRFRLRAPELTTEEFLGVAQRVPALGVLGPFLERCDQVKFAGWRPASDESLEVLAIARGFVVETRPVESEITAVPA